MSDVLFSPMPVGSLTLSNRLVMAPLTRNRAADGHVPHALNAKYYEQRASAGLIISEATQISAQGIGYPATPGIHTEAQVHGWKLVTDAVHKKGGRIVLQLWHCGRISHSSWQPDGRPAVAPSAIAAQGQAFTRDGLKPHETPRALTLEEIPEIIRQYAEGAKNALRAGFDGVEIHGANGYLVDQFTRSGTNKRTDRYGGSMDNRTRFALEVTDAIVAAVGADCVGYRISPSSGFNDMQDDDPKATFGYLAKQLSERKIAYLHVIGPDSAESGVPISYFKTIFGGPVIGNGGLTKAAAAQAISQGEFDLAAFGKLFLANPDLVRRFREGRPLNEADVSTFYGGAEKGYTDYPALIEEAA